MAARSTSAIAPALVLPAEAAPGAGFAASGALVSLIRRGDRTRGLVTGAP